MSLVEKLFLCLLFVFSSATAQESQDFDPPPHGSRKIQFTFSYSGPQSRDPSNGLSPVMALPHQNQDLGVLYSVMGLSTVERRARVRSVCADLSFERKMELGTSLGLLLSGIYDDQRSNRGPHGDDLVTVEEQWSTLKKRYLAGNWTAKAGVCRDSASTLAQFFYDCGISESAIFIDAYSTESAGHQVVSVKSPEGKLYTVNWNELTVQENAHSVGPQMAAPRSLPDVGIRQVRYNWKGEVIGMRDTSLGSLLKQATRGVLDDPLYNPTLMSLEAEALGIRLTGFQGQLGNGDRVQGATLGYQHEFGNHFGGEVVGAQADRTSELGMNARITYGRFLFFAKPEFPFQGGWKVSPVILFEGQGAIVKMHYQNQDASLKLSPGIWVTKRISPSSELYVHASQSLGFDFYNNNQADRPQLTPYRQQLNWGAGLRVSNRFEVGIQRRSDAWNRSTGVQFNIQNPKQTWGVNASVSVYETGAQKSMPVLSAGMSRTLSFKQDQFRMRAQVVEPIGGQPQVSIGIIGTIRTNPNRHRIAKVN
jgi:hypothetical protein